MSTKAKELLDILYERKFFITTAESCTGGLLSGALTALPGASKAFAFGFVTYSNEAKIKLLGVSNNILEIEGAVSASCAQAMALGARHAAAADIAIAVTGIAGPDGGTDDKPVGLVYIAVASDSRVMCNKYLFGGDRQSVRLQTVNEALQLALNLLRSDK